MRPRQEALFENCGDGGLYEREERTVPGVPGGFGTIECAPEIITKLSGNGHPTVRFRTVSGAPHTG